MDQTDLRTWARAYTLQQGHARVVVVVLLPLWLSRCWQSRSSCSTRRVQTQLSPLPSQRLGLVSPFPLLLSLLARTWQPALQRQPQGHRRHQDPPPQQPQEQQQQQRNHPQLLRALPLLSLGS